ncbi:uncharacterized protein [Lolium perenne]|uniref:uncharacterized protein n=1 Tax=Lolium perenne TaxID=4522 RepID=UPI003A98DDC4
MYDLPFTNFTHLARKVLSVISQFTEYKKFLVEQTGFAGILKLPQITRLNLRFSKWLLQKIDVGNRSIVFGENPTRQIRFFAADVHKVFGIPCGPRDIHAPESQCSPNTIKFIRTALGMNDKGNQILKVSESVIARPLDEHTSSNLEKDCFKIAFVIFLMGHLLAPSTKHDNRSIDFWGALANTDNIQDFNWCEYVLQDLFAAVRTVKDDIAKNRTSTHLYGCHLWAQVFYLDNLELGIFNLRHSVMPRVAAFDDTQMRRMILQCSTTINGVEQWSCATVRDASQICYTRAIFDSPPDQITPTISRSRPPVFPHPTATLTGEHRSQTCSAQTKPSPTIPSTHLLTASDYANYMKATYPLLASSELGIILKQHNALDVQQANAARNNSINESTRFLDKLVEVLSATCICCSLRSLPCLVQQRPQDSHSNSSASNLFRRRLDQADSDADSSSTRSTKRCKHRGPADTAPQKDKQEMQTGKDTLA